MVKLNSLFFIPPSLLLLLRRVLSYLHLFFLLCHFLCPFTFLSVKCINFVSVAPSSLVPIKSVKLSRFISCCKRGMIVLVSNASIAN